MRNATYHPEKVKEARAVLYPAFSKAIDWTGPTDTLNEAVRTAQVGASRLVDLCHMLVKDSGWWDEYEAMPEEYRPLWISTKVALIQSGASEALEGFRKGAMDDRLPHRKSAEVELADVLIRVFDLAGGLGLDVAGAMIEKLAYNQQRADHKRENPATEGCKKF